MIKEKKSLCFCDRCKNQIEENEVRTISIFGDGGAGNYHYCPDCLKDYGFLIDDPNKKAIEADIENYRILRRQIFKILKELGVPIEKKMMVKFFKIYRKKEKQRKKRWKRE